MCMLLREDIEIFLLFALAVELFYYEQNEPCFIPYRLHRAAASEREKRKMWNG